MVLGASSKFPTKPSRNFLDLATCLSPCLLLLITEQPAKNLTTRALGNRIHKSNASLQPLMASFVVFNILHESLGD